MHGPAQRLSGGTSSSEVPSGEDPSGGDLAGRQPNILLVMTDQQRFDSLGCYGSTWTHTPVLDRMALEGIRFETCYANNPICTPSRASLMTGKELPGHGVYRLHDCLPADEILFTQRLRDEGYHTALYGKLHVSGRVEEAVRRHPHDGFDVYEYCCEPALDLDSPLNGYGRWLREKHPDFYELIKTKGRERGHDPVECSMNCWAADRTIGFIRDHAQAEGATGRGGRKPFFCMMSVFDPHNPYENHPQEMSAFVDPRAIPRPAGSEDGGELPYAFTAERDHCYMGSPADFPASAIAAIRRGYAAMVAHIDLEVGRVLETLRESGLADSTLVLFTSDHGDLLGDHGAFAKGAMLHDPCIRVPLLMQWPGRIPPGTVNRGLAQLNDLAATILVAAGIDREKVALWMPEAKDLLESVAPADPAKRGDPAGCTGQAGHAGSSDGMSGMTKIAGTDQADGEVRTAAEDNPAERRTGEGTGPRQVAVCAYRNSGIDDTGRYRNPEIHSTMVRRGRWKLHAYHPVPGIQSDPVYKLFDMERDPGERRDLALFPECAAILDGLKDDLVAWLLKAELSLGGRGGQAAPRKDQLVKNALEFDAAGSRNVHAAEAGEGEGTGEGKGSRP